MFPYILHTYIYSLKHIDFRTYYIGLIKTIQQGNIFLEQNKCWNRETFLYTNLYLLLYHLVMSICQLLIATELKIIIKY